MYAQMPRMGDKQRRREGGGNGPTYQMLVGHQVGAAVYDHVVHLALVTGVNDRLEFDDVALGNRFEVRDRR